SAFGQSTPAAWFALLREDLKALPHLAGAVAALLEELPDVDTALTSTEVKLLKLISRGVTAPMRVIGEYWGENPLAVPSYWELGRTLDRLARCPTPAILGLDIGPFTSQMHDDVLRF